MPRGIWCVFALCAGGCFTATLWAAEPAKPPRPQPAIPRAQQWQVMHGAQMRMQLRNRALQQVRRQAGNDDGEIESADGYSFREDRETLTVLRKTTELLEQKRFAEAVEALGRLLENGEDHFIRPPAGTSIYRSAKTEARRALADMPAEGRESYELQFGALARQSLDKAVGQGDIDAVAEVARRFFHTRAGYEAAFLLGMHHADHGRPLAAAHAWKQLLALGDRAKEEFEPLLSVSTAKALFEAGHESEATELLIKARAALAAMPLQVAGQPLAWFDQDEQALDWLRQLSTAPPHGSVAQNWTMFRGGPSRNDTSAGGTPLLAYRWRVPTANDDPAVERAVSQLHHTYEDEGLTTLAGLHPLAVGDVVLMRTARNLMAVDFRTGKRIWEVPADNPFEQLPSTGATPVESPGARFNAYGPNSSQGAVELLERRMWDDAIFGMLSSDDELVFAVEPADSDASAYTQNTVIFGNAGPRVQSMLNVGAQTNRLAAYEIATGKLKWEIGGPKSNFPLEQAGAFFLGPPLPLFGKLYVLAEIDGEMRLMALESATGALAWSQQIAVGAQEFLGDQLPHLAGATPSYADGVLVCPTSAGAVVAIDLASRSLLWGIHYPRQLDPWMYGQQRNNWLQMNMYQGGRDNDAQLRWSDATVTLAAGKVLLAFPDSDKLFCHDLLSGAKLWEAARDDGLYVAGVEEDNVFVVGANRIRALGMSDGKERWERDRGAYPNKARPTGRGFTSEHVYYLPTTAGEVLGYDLRDGRLISEARPVSAINGSRQDRLSLGNLICHRGSVISHGVEYLECFDQLNVLAERTAAVLAATPDDSRALMRMGEIQLQRRDYPSAIASLSRAWELDANRATRRLLVDAYLTVMQQDFASVRDQLATIEKAIEEPEERSAYLRLKANGLEKSGDRVAAFTAYQELASVNGACPAGVLEAVSSSWNVRCERLVRGHLERLYQAAIEAGDDAAAAEMKQRVAQAWETTGAGANRAALETFVAHYGGFEVAQAAQLSLAQARMADGDWLSAEMMLLDLERGSQPELARRAWAQHALLLVAAGRPDDAAIYYERLDGEWADLPCGENRTGREWLEQLPGDHAVRQAMQRKATFGAGEVAVVDKPAEFSVTSPRAIVDMDGALGAFYRSSNFFVGQTVRNNVISVEDGLGVRRWEAPLVDPKRPDAPIAITNVQLSQGRVHGHLVILAYGFHLFVIDPLGDPKHGEPRVIWRADLAESIPGMARMQAISSMQVPQTFGPTRNVAVDSVQRRIGNTACLGEAGIVYQSGRTLCCVSPVTGEIQWTREDMEAGSTLFGDAEVVCVIGHMSREVQLLDAVDGHDLEKREVPEEMRRIAMHGRLLVSWTDDREAKQQELSCRDMLTNETVWFERFAANSRGWSVDDESIGVYEPGGKFKLIRIADGKPLVNEMLERSKTLADIFVFAGRDQYTLLVNDVVPQQDRRRINPVAGGLNNPAVFGNGKLYAFDSKTGRPLWRKPTEVLKQGVALRQPADLPALVFLSMPSGGGGRVARRQGNLLCIDKRTGRELYQQTYQLADGANGLQLSADVAKQTMSVATNGKSFELQFKDGPPPPEPPDAAGDLQAEGKKSGPGSVLFSALKALGQASQDVASPIRPAHEDFQTGNGSQFFETDDSGGSQFGDDLPPFEGEDDDEDPFLPE